MTNPASPIRRHLGRPLRRPGKATGSPLSLAIVLGLALAAAGCQTDTADLAGIHQTGSIEAVRATDRHPINVVKNEIRLEIEVPGYSRRLTPRQHNRVDAYLAQYKAVGESEITISVPSGGRNESAAMSMLGHIRKSLARAGVRATSVRYTPYYARNASDAPIILGFQRYQAVASPCGMWPKNLADEPNNKPYANFGCATQNNLAAMVANPYDLIEPRTMTAADTQRRATILELYRKGEVTSATRSDDEKANASEVKE
ncbi:MAG: CpaD family pilus assembly protein [Alphaproteobacteria bacterium]